MYSDVIDLRDFYQTRLGEVARRLIGFGCDKLQGYLYSRPLPLDRLVAWLEARRLSQSNS